MPPDTLVKCAKVRNVLVVLISSHPRQSFVFVSPLPLACASSSWVCTSSTWACTSLSSIYTSATSACACQETTRLLCLLTTTRQKASSIYAKSCQTTCCYIDYTNETRKDGKRRDETGQGGCSSSQNVFNVIALHSWRIAASRRVDRLPWDYQFTYLKVKREREIFSYPIYTRKSLNYQRKEKRERERYIERQ